MQINDVCCMGYDEAKRKRAMARSRHENCVIRNSRQGNVAVQQRTTPEMVSVRKYSIERRQNGGFSSRRIFDDSMLERIRFGHSAFNGL